MDNVLTISEVEKNIQRGINMYIICEFFSAPCKLSFPQGCQKSVLAWADDKINCGLSLGLYDPEGIKPHSWRAYKIPKPHAK